jgi:hypothetical protein
MPVNYKPTNEPVSIDDIFTAMTESLLPTHAVEK